MFKLVHSYPLLARLVSELSGTSTFDEASALLLRIMFERVLFSLQESSLDYTQKAQLLRAVVHWRPADAEQRLVCIDRTFDICVDAPSHLSSPTVWRLLIQHGCPVSLDLPLGRLTAWTPDEPIQFRESASPVALLGQETREQLLKRETTHMHVVPLWAPGGRIVGMIAIEARCLTALGREFIWSDCHEDLTLLANAGAPFLVGLPPIRSSPAIHADELLPVVGTSTSSLIEVLRVFATQEETILISGPTGAGKSRLARWCHEHSQRKNHPFETLDLLSIPEDLQMAELFGWKRGAFTGAVKDKPGAITRAAGGTLFIDEIDKLSLKAQAGLLHVLEEHQFRPLGDEGSERQADVRFIVGTNADLHAAVRDGRFREDLFFRINILPVRVPALAERVDEIPQWAQFMLMRRHRENFEEGLAQLTPDAVDLLVQAPWPGNLRQLDNIIRRAYALAFAPSGTQGTNLFIDRVHIERALAHEVPTGARNTMAPMWQAAHAFVQEGVRRAQRGEAFSLDLSDAFRGLVLAAAIVRLGGAEEALAMFGLEQLFKNRNQKRTLRREMSRVRKLANILQEPLDPRLSAILSEIEASPESSER